MGRVVASVEGNSYADFSVKFKKPFTVPPHVVCCIYSTSTGVSIGSIEAAVNNITETGVTFRVFNNDSAGRSPGINWIAVDQAEY